MMVVLRTQAFEQGNRVRERRNPLRRAVRHIGRGLPFPAYGGHIRALFDQVMNQFVISPCGRVMQRRIAIAIAKIEVGATFLDQKPNGIKPVIRDMSVRMRHEVLPVARPGRRMNGIDVRSTDFNRR